MQNNDISEDILKEIKNKFKYFNKVYYSELPLTFSVTTSYIVVLNDIAVLENEIPGINEEIKEHIKVYMVDHVNNGGFLRQKIEISYVPIMILI